jgi:hypothetical protein
MSLGDRMGLLGAILALVALAVTILWPDKKWIGWLALGAALFLLVGWAWLEVGSELPRLRTTYPLLSAVVVFLVGGCIAVGLWRLAVIPIKRPLPPTNLEAYPVEIRRLPDTAPKTELSPPNANTHRAKSPTEPAITEDQLRALLKQHGLHPHGDVVVNIPVEDPLSPEKDDQLLGDAQFLVGELNRIEKMYIGYSQALSYPPSPTDQLSQQLGRHSLAETAGEYGQVKGKVAQMITSMCYRMRMVSVQKPVPPALLQNSGGFNIDDLKEDRLYLENLSRQFADFIEKSTPR